jgi:hypothetical protein
MSGNSGMQGGGECFCARCFLASVDTHRFPPAGALSFTGTTSEGFALTITDSTLEGNVAMEGNGGALLLVRPAGAALPLPT